MIRALSSLEVKESPGNIEDLKMVTGSFFMKDTFTFKDCTLKDIRVLSELEMKGSRKSIHALIGLRD